MCSLELQLDSCNVTTSCENSGITYHTKIRSAIVLVHLKLRCSRLSLPHSEQLHNFQLHSGTLIRMCWTCRTMNQHIIQIAVTLNNNKHHQKAKKKKNWSIYFCIKLVCHDVAGWEDPALQRGVYPRSVSVAMLLEGKHMSHLFSRPSMSFLDV